MRGMYKVSFPKGDPIVLMAKHAKDAIVGAIAIRVELKRIEADTDVAHNERAELQRLQRNGLITTRLIK